MPESMSQMIPAACLFATVFTIGPLARNSELTAAKASGLSFHRLILPLVIAALFASGFSFLVERGLHPGLGPRPGAPEGHPGQRDSTEKYNFVYRGSGNWLYAIRMLETEDRSGCRAW